MITLDCYPKDSVALVSDVFLTPETALDRPKVEHDFLIRGVFIRNEGRKTVRIESVVFEIRAQGKTVQEVAYRGDGLEPKILRSRQEYEATLGPLAPFVFGHDPPCPLDALSQTPRLAAGQTAPLLFQRFRVDCDPAPDAVVVRARATSDNGPPGASETRLTLKPRLSENEPVFPVGGPCLVLSAFDNPHVVSHRRLLSQEFALDIVRLLPSGVYHPEGRQNPDYACYGDPVMAVCDGEVVTAHDGYPENPSGGALLDPDRVAELAATHGPFAPLVGNHVILRHARGEHSLYVHLIPQSLCVKPGQEVRAGETIGKLGNCGMSGGPHLHFAMMDGPDPVRAHGLCCRFRNLTNLVWDTPETRVLKTNYLVQSTAPRRT